MRAYLSALLPCFLFSACGGGKSVRTVAKAGPPVRGVEVAGILEGRIPLEHEDAIGISGSCKNQEGTWFVAEGNGRLLHLDDQGQLTSHAIEGLPNEIDLEGLACTDNRFYISTESEVPDRRSDLVLEVAVDGDRAAVQSILSMQYPESMSAASNQGLEGLCIAGDWLIAAGEILRSESGVRQAPVFRQRIGDDETFLHWVNLTSSTGKISGLDCRLQGDAIEVFGIERHYEVGRIVHYILAEEAAESETVVELAPLIRDTENFEAVLVEDDGRVRLANDNQYKTVTGPSEETTLQAIKLFAR